MSIEEILVLIEAQRDEFSFWLAQFLVDIFYTNSSTYWFSLSAMTISIGFIAVRMRMFCRLGNDERPTILVKLARVLFSAVPFYALLATILFVSLAGKFGGSWIEINRPEIY